MAKNEVLYKRLRRLPEPKAGTNNATLSVFKTDTAGSNKGQVGDPFPLWVNEISSDFSITGGFAQSAGKRDFYPRNFNQPSYSFGGQSFNERHYGELGEFIRDGQLSSIFHDTLFMIDVPTAGADFDRRDKLIKRNLRGERAALKLHGYINSIDRAHAVGRYAPDYQFIFVVSRALAGPFRDQVVNPSFLPSNWDSFVNRTGAGRISDPDDVLLAEDRAAELEKVREDDDYQDLRNPS